MKIKRLFALSMAMIMLALLVPSAMARQAGALYKGDKDSDFTSGTPVTEAQTLLRDLAYYTGAIDGVFGSGMEKAVKAFQRRNKLTQDGIIGKSTWTVLRSGSAVKATDPVFQILSFGSTGDRVKTLQTMLTNEYYFAGEIDGIFGSSVRTAVLSFQASTGLTCDGKVGSATWNALVNRTPRIFNGGYPIRTLKGGMRGYDVYVLQQRLRSLGFLVGSVANGFYGERVTAAVKLFQAKNGLSETGNVTRNTVLYLWPTSTKPVDDGTLKLGSSGEDVSALQMRLKAAGYLLSPVDGVFGPKTRDAVRLLQKHYGLEQDGIVGKETKAIIDTFPLDQADPGTGGVVYKPLRLGAGGATVRQMQERLIGLGYLAAGENDGIFGQRTRKAVMAFQKEYNLKIDGVAGAETLGLLFSRTEP